MSSGMPELGSKISLISKADIRYEGRLFTVDPQECTIALANVRSFGTEDRETQFPVAPQNQVYDYILFRGSDIKDIRVVNNVPSMPNDPAIMQLSVPASMGGGAIGPQYSAPQYQHPIVGSAQYPQYHPMGGLPANMRPMKQPSELVPQVPDIGPLAPGAPPQQPPMSSVAQVKDQGSMLDLIGGGNVQNNSRSATPSAPHRKSPTTDQGTQVGSGAGGQRDRRNSNNAQRNFQQHNFQQQNFQQQNQPVQQRNRPNSRNRNQIQQQQGGNRDQGSQPAREQHGQRDQREQRDQHMQREQPQNHNQQNQHPHHGYDNWRGRGGGGWRGRGRGRGGFPSNRNKNTLKFDSEYDFEQANTEFEELRSKLAKAKIEDDKEINGGEIEKKDDSGNETGAGEAEPEEDENFTPYDKTKSFFDNISCEAVERQKGRSQRTDWRTERKLNSETFGVASARRGAWRGRGGWRQYPQHQPWRAGGRGGRGRGNYNSNNMTNPNMNINNRQRAPNNQLQQPQPAAVAK